MELVVHNFGPIKDAHIETKRYNVIIGNTSTGKSVLAKLVSIAYDPDFYVIDNGNFTAFNKLLQKYCIDFPFKNDAYIEIKLAAAHWRIANNKFEIVSRLFAPFFTNGNISLSKFPEFIKKWSNVTDNGKTTNHPQYKEALKALQEIYENIRELKRTDLTAYSQFAVDMSYHALVSQFYSLFASIYIPAERNLMSVFTNNIFTFLKSGSNIPESIKRFGSLYEAAKGENKNLQIDFMNIKVNFSNEDNTITLGSDNTDIRFEQASSGMQSIIPLWAVYMYGIHKYANATAIIEEPELNLFPTLQADLVNNLVTQLNTTKASILITTHSPYILSVFDNLIYANDVYNKATTQEIKQKIEKLVPQQMMIDYDEVAAYLCNDDGVVERINDDEMRSTGAYALDSASNINSHIFNALMTIENEL